MRFPCSKNVRGNLTKRLPLIVSSPDGRSHSAWGIKLSYSRYYTRRTAGREEQQCQPSSQSCLFVAQ